MECFLNKSVVIYVGIKFRGKMLWFKRFLIKIFLIDFYFFICYWGLRVGIWKFFFFVIFEKKLV